MKRIYKSTTNKKISGVCGGLGIYFNIDPNIIRIIFIIAICLNLIFILAYILCAIIIPEDNNIIE